MDRRQRAIVAGIHRLKHVQCLFAADLADNNAIGAHTQAVNEQLPLLYRPCAFNVCGPALEPDHVPLFHDQLGRILDGYDTFFVGDIA